MARTDGEIPSVIIEKEKMAKAVSFAARKSFEVDRNVINRSIPFHNGQIETEHRARKGKKAE
jgi:hypothetical protein